MLRRAGTSLQLRPWRRLLSTQAPSAAGTINNQSLSTLEEVDKALSRMRAAQHQFREYNQEQVDRIFEEAAHKARMRAVELAKFAVQESGIGLVEDKVLKNLYASEYSVNKYKDLKTCGIIEMDEMGGVCKMAEPVGPICAIVPCTNPTSTVIIKSLFALKTRNCILFLPHPRTKLCTSYTAQLMSDFAVAAGAPEGSIMCAAPNKELSKYIMQHDAINFILATGGPSMVHASYTSGKPAIGVGAGNAPALVDETYDLPEAVNSIVIGKTFDWGTICASEQSVIVVDKVYDEAKRLMIKRGVHFLNEEEKQQLGKVFMPKGHLNPEIVGKSPQVIAALAGLSIPPNAIALCVEASEIGPQEVFSFEKLSPILALYRARDFEDGVEVARKLAENGGIGHTSCLYTDPKNHDRISLFKDRVPTYHTIVNMPTSLGAIGIKYNMSIDPSMTLGVGTQGGSSSSVNVGPRELINIKTVAQKMDYVSFFKVPSIYSNSFCLRAALDDVMLSMSDDIKGGRTAVLVCTRELVRSGMVDIVTAHLRKSGFRVKLHTNIEPQPTFECVKSGVQVLKEVEPGLLIALGGGAVIDTGKLMRLHYEHPDCSIEQLSAPFLEMRWRNFEIPVQHKKIYRFIAIPTTCGSGSEMTPFTELRVMEANRRYRKVPICSYSLTPDIVIQDPQFVRDLPSNPASYTGFEALSQAIESFTSVMSTSQTRLLSKDAAATLFRNLPESSADQHSHARDKVYFAAGQVGMAMANTFLGTATAMATKFGSQYNVPHGVALALFLPHVIRFNSTDSPTRITAFPGYPYPMAKAHYAELADAMGVGGGPEVPAEEKVERLVCAIEDLKVKLGLPRSIQDLHVVTETDYLAAVTAIADETFGDQLGAANPRYALMEDLRALYTQAFYGIDPTGDQAVRVVHSEKEEPLVSVPTEHPTPSFFISQPTTTTQTPP